MVLFSPIDSVQSTPCNSFPKIFGGSTANTRIRAMDAFNDYLVFAGSTSDGSLTTIANEVPYIALSSISTGGKYYWAKALILNTGESIYGVKFSTDGELIIAHSGSSITSNFIVVINKSTADILSAR